MLFELLPLKQKWAFNINYPSETEVVLLSDFLFIFFEKNLYMTLTVYSVTKRNFVQK